MIVVYGILQYSIKYFLHSNCDIADIYEHLWTCDASLFPTEYDDAFTSGAQRYLHI